MGDTIDTRLKPLIDTSTSIKTATETAATRFDVALSTRSSAANQTTEIARLTSILAQLDVALSTLASQTTLASADSHLANIDTDALAIVTNTSTTANQLDVALSTRLKPADTLAGVTALGSITNALPAGTNTIGKTDQGAGGTSAWKVKDDYQAGEILADQNGAGAVLTFTFASAVDRVLVADIGATATNVSRIDPFGGTPAITTGIPLLNGKPAEEFAVTPASTTVKVYSPVGSTICMSGYRRT